MREIDPLGAVTSCTWDRYDRQQSRTDALGQTTLFEHDEDGDLRAVVRPDGSRVAVTRHLDGALDVSVEAAGRIWRRTYPAGSAPDPYTTQLGISDGSAETAAEEEPAEPGTAAVTAAQARERGTDTDLFGRPKAVLDVVGGRNQLRWSVEGKLLARTNPAGAQEQWRYDRQGNELGHIGLLGQAEVREYGPFDLLTAVTDATGARTSYTYDTELRLVAVTNPAGLTWHYTYDPAGRLAAESDFDGRVSRYAHDAAGRLVRSESGRPGGRVHLRRARQRRLPAHGRRADDVRPRPGRPARHRGERRVPGGHRTRRAGPRPRRTRSTAGRSPSATTTKTTSSAAAHRPEWTVCGASTRTVSR